MITNCTALPSIFWNISFKVLSGIPKHLIARMIQFPFVPLGHDKHFHWYTFCQSLWDETVQQSINKGGHSPINNWKTTLEKWYKKTLCVHTHFQVCVSPPKQDMFSEMGVHYTQIRAEMIITQTQEFSSWWGVNFYK